MYLRVENSAIFLRLRFFGALRLHKWHFRNDFEMHGFYIKNGLESLNGGFANGGLRYSSTIVHDCLQLSSFCHENSLYKRPRKCTIAHDCAQIAESGLKPPFESPHLDFSEMGLLMGLVRGAVFQHGTVSENSPLTLVGHFPSLMGRLPILVGRFPECLNGPFSLSSIP